MKEDHAEEPGPPDVSLVGSHKIEERCDNFWVWAMVTMVLCTVVGFLCFLVGLVVA